MDSTTDELFSELWKQAKPYYEQGRVYDIAHIKWLIPHAKKFAIIENLDPLILVPIAILHDVGYSQLQNKNPDIKGIDYKRLHMEKGAEISLNILQRMQYDPERTKLIVHFIKNHDNWAFSDNKIYGERKEFSAFTDLDFLWINFNYWIFCTIAESQKLSPIEFLERWKKDEKLVNRPFCSKYSKSLWEKSIKWVEAKVLNHDKPLNNGPILKG